MLARRQGEDPSHGLSTCRPVMIVGCRLPTYSLFWIMNDSSNHV